MSEWGSRGSRQPNSRLTEADVLEIKRLLASGWKIADVADRFGVGKTTISNIKNGLIWSHVRLARRNDA